MNKKKIIVVIIICLFGVFLITNKYYYKDNVNKEQPNNIKNDKNMLSLMLETDVGSGTYSVSSSSDWSNEEYIYNSELSKCENGSILSWDENKNVAIMKGNISDKCYLYFDKIDPNSPKPTNPTLAFDSTYNVVISGSTSENGGVEYYYSFDNVNYNKGSTISVNETSTIYAYSKDIKKRKSDVVSKVVTISNSTKGTVSTAYYCSKNGTYKTSSSCTYTYNATSKTEYVCSVGSYSASLGHCYDTNGRYSKWDSSTCNSTCGLKTYNPEGYSFECVEDNTGNYYYCQFNTGSPTKSTSYSCTSGDSLSGSKCTNSYTGTLKYKCGNKYYSNNTDATTACENYCATGTHYNGKCYKIS